MNRAFALVTLLVATPAMAETLYSIEQDMLIKTEVNLFDGEVESQAYVGQLGVPTTVGALTPPVNGVMYATGGNLNRWLLAVDAHTGEASVVGHMGVRIDTLAVNPITGRIFGTGESDWLFSIDSRTAELDAVGFMGSQEGPAADLMWVDGVGLVGRWDTSIGGMLGEIDVYTGDALFYGSAMPLKDGSKMVYSAEDDVFYETSGVNVRAHRATASDFSAFLVYAMR